MYPFASSFFHSSRLRNVVKVVTMQLLLYPILLVYLWASNKLPHLIVTESSSN